MNALSTDVEVPSVVPATRRRRKLLASPRPAHAAEAPADQPVPRAPHNVACPVCGVGVGTHCRTQHTGVRGGPSFSHIERRVLAGQALRAQVYARARTLVDPDEAKHPPGTAFVRDSLADDPVWGRR